MIAGISERCIYLLIYIVAYICLWQTLKCHLALDMINIIFIIIIIIIQHNIQSFISTTL